jgi:hypothetical protein
VRKPHKVGESNTNDEWENTGKIYQGAVRKVWSREKVARECEHRKSLRGNLEVLIVNLGLGIHILASFIGTCSSRQNVWVVMPSSWVGS